MNSWVQTRLLHSSMKISFWENRAPRGRITTPVRHAEIITAYNNVRRRGIAYIMCLFIFDRFIKSIKVSKSVCKVVTLLRSLVIKRGKSHFGHNWYQKFYMAYPPASYRNCTTIEYCTEHVVRAVFRCYQKTGDSMGGLHCCLSGVNMRFWASAADRGPTSKQCWFTFSCGTKRQRTGLQKKVYHWTTGDKVVEGVQYFHRYQRTSAVRNQ